MEPSTQPLCRLQLVTVCSCLLSLLTGRGGKRLLLEGSDASQVKVLALKMFDFHCFLTPWEDASQLEPVCPLIPGWEQEEHHVRLCEKHVHTAICSGDTSKQVLDKYQYMGCAASTSPSTPTTKLWGKAGALTNPLCRNVGSSFLTGRGRVSHASAFQPLIFF